MDAFYVGASQTYPGRFAVYGHTACSVQDLTLIDNLVSRDRAKHWMQEHATCNLRRFRDERYEGIITEEDLRNEYQANPMDGISFCQWVRLCLSEQGGTLEEITQN